MRKKIFYRSSVKVLVISFISIYSQAFASDLSFEMKESVQIQVIKRDLLENGPMNTVNKNEASVKQLGKEKIVFPEELELALRMISS